MRRDPVVRDFIDSDMRYLWLLYRTDRLSHLEVLKPIMSAAKDAAEFRDATATLLTEFYDYAFVLESGKPVGICFGIECHTHMLLVDLVWLPWVSNRKKLEVCVKLVQFLGEVKPVQFMLSKDLNEFGIHICRHGVARKVGACLDTLLLYESRSVEWQPQFQP